MKEGREKRGKGILQRRKEGENVRKKSERNQVLR